MEVEFNKGWLKRGGSKGLSLQLGSSERNEQKWPWEGWGAQPRDTTKPRPGHRAPLARPGKLGRSEPGRGGRLVDRNAQGTQRAASGPRGCAFREGRKARDDRPV